VVDKLATTGKMRSFKFLKMLESDVQFCNRVGALKEKYLCTPFACDALKVGGRQYTHLVESGFSYEEVNTRAACGRRRVDEIRTAQEKARATLKETLVA